MIDELKDTHDENDENPASGAVVIAIVMVSVILTFVGAATLLATMVLSG